MRIKYLVQRIIFVVRNFNEFNEIRSRIIANKFIDSAVHNKSDDRKEQTIFNKIFENEDCDFIRISNI